MLALLALATLLPALAGALPCVQFDANGDLYAFGGEKDVHLGPSSSWASPTPKNLTSVGRPPFSGTNLQCLLSEFSNAMYVVGGDANDHSTIYIYDFAGDKWSKQLTTGAPPVISSSRSSAVLDHDTNQLFTVAPGQNLYDLDLSNIKNTGAGSIAWSDVRKPSFTTDNYKVTAAGAANHILFFGAPNTAAGSANLFVIHYAYFQPQAQAFAGANGAQAIPAGSGQAVSIPSSSKNETIPYQILFVPDDFSNSYIVTHWTDLANYTSTVVAPMSVSLINSTQTFAAPTAKDKEAAYAASQTALVQIDTQGNIYYAADVIKTDYTVNAGATWTKLNYQVTGSPKNASAANATTTANASSSASSSGSGSPTGSSSSVKPTATAPASGALPISLPTVGIALSALALAVATIF